MMYGKMINDYLWSLSVLLSSSSIMIIIITLITTITTTTKTDAFLLTTPSSTSTSWSWSSSTSSSYQQNQPITLFPSWSITSTAASLLSLTRRRSRYHQTFIRMPLLSLLPSSSDYSSSTSLSLSSSTSTSTMSNPTTSTTSSKSASTLWDDDRFQLIAKQYNVTIEIKQASTLTLQEGQQQDESMSPASIFKLRAQQHKQQSSLSISQQQEQEQEQVPKPQNDDKNFYFKDHHYTHSNDYDGNDDDVENDDDDDEQKEQLEKALDNNNNSDSDTVDDEDEEIRLEREEFAQLQKQKGSIRNNDDYDMDNKNDNDKSYKDVETTKMSTTEIIESQENTNPKAEPITSLQKCGVQIGSMGGWNIMIYPGDYIVHRKYGIGQYSGLSLQSKSKLSEHEMKLRDDRRATILSTELRALNRSVTVNDIQAIRIKFGTVQDYDIISNPQMIVLHIQYADVVVHVPIDRAYRLSRYKRVSDTGMKPKLTKVYGSTSWNDMKYNIELNTIELAQDVLLLYTIRETYYRIPMNPIYEYKLNEFVNNTFAFIATPDQNKCFLDVENDMIYKTKPMDRLICGDVGYGKTEIAIRALYRSVINGKQCALLAPTSVLASQHYKNIYNRMKHYNITITLLRGGTSQSAAGRIIRQQIHNGTIQLIIGTHALLSKGVTFHESFQLLVIDEEQRFGVKQKERIKLISNGVDVLTLSATPIPRTLQMSLSGLRDTSIIQTPPPLRKQIQTYVTSYNEEMIYEAILNELNRNGQCYYVVPRISQLYDAEQMIIRLFPNIRLIQAHGRMKQQYGAEYNVALFAEGKYDILLATTVIENGIDIPNVNTIIVQNSQSFGMSTLYQLRGRVGRSNQQAYAYFFHSDDYDINIDNQNQQQQNPFNNNDDQPTSSSTFTNRRNNVGSITEQAMMKLNAINDLNSLSSTNNNNNNIMTGFDIANRDLEIRGAGSLLGVEQSGIASKVGFDLYMKLLKKSIRQLRGLDLPISPRTNILLPYYFLIPPTSSETTDSLSTSSSSLSHITMTIPETYINDPIHRYQEECMVRLADSTNQLINITQTWKMKYGPIPNIVQNQLKLMHLYACTRRLGIDLVSYIDTGLEIETIPTDIDDEVTDSTTTSKKTKKKKQDDTNTLTRTTSIDLILRSPGLRPRHWATILSNLTSSSTKNRKVLRQPKGLDVIFPKRFKYRQTLDDDSDLIIVDGQVININQLVKSNNNNNDGDSNNNYDDADDADWDALDEEEEEAMKEISSAVNIQNIDEIDIEQYPRIMIRNIGTKISTYPVNHNNNKKKKMNKNTNPTEDTNVANNDNDNDNNIVSTLSFSLTVDQLLKCLLPLSRVVYDKQHEQMKKAETIAVERQAKQQKQQQENDNVASSQEIMTMNNWKPNTLSFTNESTNKKKSKKTKKRNINY